MFLEVIDLTNKPSYWKLQLCVRTVTSTHLSSNSSTLGLWSMDLGRAGYISIIVQVAVRLDCLSSCNC